MATTLDERIEAAADLLTLHFGDDRWKRQIDLSTLRMNDVYDCVLGQLFGSFNEGHEQLLRTAGFFSVFRSALFGFDVSHDDSYPELQTGWHNYLVRERAA